MQAQPISSCLTGKKYTFRQGFLQKFVSGYGIFKNQQIPHEIKENPSFCLFLGYCFHTLLAETLSGTCMKSIPWRCGLGVVGVP
jgi:hypothetical protein